jgi:C-terminal processing protease CtpA/Prc
VRGRAKAYGQDFDEIIDQFFGEIRKKGIQKLIIDVRGNEGGNNPEKLYSYIAKQNSRNPDAKRDDKNAYITPARNNFEGQVIVLANERSISAQETFVSIFKNNKRGFIVGQATPGCFKGLCGGKKHRLVMPNSRFEIRIPMHASPRTYDAQVNYTEGEGFPPDFRIEEKIKDILEGKDAMKEFAVGLIKKD